MAIDAGTANVSEVQSGTARGLGNQTYEALLDLIMARTLQPGELVPERRLAERLGVSRTPMREALHRLEGEGLLERRAGGKLFVRQITVQDYMEALHVRRILESEAAAKAAGHVPAQALEELRVRLETLLKGGDPAVPDHRQTDEDLHDMIGEACGNRLMAEITGRLRHRTRMFSMKRMPERFEPICREHIVIVDALASGDAGRAAAAMIEHIDNVKQSILKKLAEL